MKPNFPKNQPPISPWVIARCPGEENLGAALDDMHQRGFEIKFVLFSGQVPMKQSSLVGADQTMIVPMFTVIARSPDHASN